MHRELERGCSYARDNQDGVLARPLIAPASRGIWLVDKENPDHLRRPDFNFDHPRLRYRSVSPCRALDGGGEAAQDRGVPGGALVGAERLRPIRPDSDPSNLIRVMPAQGVELSPLHRDLRNRAGAGFAHGILDAGRER